MKTFKNYFRQYSGYLKEKGDRLLSINFLWDKYTIWDKIRKVLTKGKIIEKDTIL